MSGGWPFGDIEPGSVDVLYVDPPWHFKARTALKVANPGSRRDVERHYETMSLKDILDLPAGQLAAKNCHLFMWVTGPMLDRGFEVMRAWGFRYSSDVFVWVKLKKSHDPKQLRVLPTAAGDLFTGLGLTSRKNAEYVLLGRRGSPKRIAKNVRQIILAPVREHSRKPEEARERIEEYVGPGLTMVELFSRSERPGWTSWGLETGKFE